MELKIYILCLTGLVVCLAAPHDSDVFSSHREKRSDCHHPRVSTCEVCSGNSRNPRCKNGLNFGPFCYREFSYTSQGWTTTIGVASETECRANAHKSRLVNSNCDLNPPPVGTHCYDCCTTPTCHGIHGRCNQQIPINITLIPDFIKQAANVATTKKSIPTTTTTIPTTTTSTTTATTTTTPTTTTSTTTATTTTTPTTTTSTTTSTTTTPTTTTSTTIKTPTTRTTPKPTIPTTTTKTTTITTSTTPITTHPDTTTTTKIVPTSVTITTANMPTTVKTISSSATIPFSTANTGNTTSVMSNQNSIITTNPVTVATKQGSLCQVCKDDGQTSCNNTHYVHCPANKPYCMNDVIYDKLGTRQIIKKCTSELFCYWDWWIGTQTDQRCNRSVSQNVTQDVCHYCCQSGNGSSLPCNVDEIPKQLVSFKKPTKGKVCSTSDPSMNGQYLNKECPKEEPFCMNDVFYDAKVTNNVAMVIKRCVSEAICKGDWWLKSKKRPECLSGDISKLKEGNLLCHYCCLSDDTGPCNNDTRPKQIFDFLTKSTSNPSSLSTTSKDIHLCDDKHAVVTALAHNQIVTINGTNCPGGKYEYSDTLVTKFCNATSWHTWKRGLKVIDNCSKLPKFTTVAAFANVDYTHDGLAGILLSCSTSQISIVAQSCNSNAQVLHIGRNSNSYVTNIDNFYSIKW